MAASPSVLCVNLDGERIEEQRVGTWSARLRAHEASDPELKKLRERLSVERTKAPWFEEAVAVLLHLAGFAVEHMRLQSEAFDLLAFGPDERILCIECSVDAPDTDKMQKLLSRTTRLAGTLRRSGQASISVMSVFFLSIPRDDIAESVREEALERGLLIVCRQEIEELLEAIEQGEATPAALDIIGMAGRERIFPRDLKE